MYDILTGGYSKEDFSKFIKKGNVAALAVSGSEWGVQVTSVFYAVEKDFSILIKSHRASEHGRAMQENPHIALAIYDPASTYTDKSGIQLRAICERIYDKKEMCNAVNIYSSVFSGAEARFAPVEELISPDAKSTLFRMKIVSGKMLTPSGYSSIFQKF